MMKNKRILACLLCALLLLPLIGTGAFAATPVAPVTILIGHSSRTRAEFYGLDYYGQRDVTTLYSDITKLTFTSEGIAEIIEEGGVLYIRGLAEGTVGFSATSASHGELTGSLTVQDVSGRTDDVVFERAGGKSVVVPKQFELFTGQARSFYAQQAAFAIRSNDASVPTNTIATLGHDRDKIIVRSNKSGSFTLFVRDNLTGSTAACEVIVTNLQLNVEFNRDMKKALRVGETATARGTFSPALSEEQLSGARWISYSPDVASVDPKTGLITAHSPGIAEIFLYLPLTNRYYGLGIGHYDSVRGDVAYGVLVES